MPQPFLAVTLAAWSGGLSVTPHLGLYLEETLTIFPMREGEEGCRQEVGLDLAKKRIQEYSSGGTTRLFSPLTPEIFC